MNRIDRLTAILIQLQSKRVVKAQEIADRFDISLRTVYRDVRALEEAGIPLIGEAGVGYSIVEGYRLPPVMFTKEEASALLFGAKLVEKMSDQSVRREFKSALYKIQAVLKLREKDHLETLESVVEVIQPPRSGSSQFANHYLTEVQQAIVQKNVLWIEYFASHNETFTQREVEPMGLLYYNDNWHLIAYCRLRDGYRDFRVDRIKQLRNPGQSFTARPEHSFQTYLTSISNSRQLQEVVIRIDKPAVRYLREQRYDYGYVSEKDLGNTVEMHFLSGYPEAIGRWLLMFGKMARVEQPEALKERMCQLAQEIHQHYC